MIDPLDPPLAVSFDFLTDLELLDRVGVIAGIYVDLHPGPAAQRRLHRDPATSARRASWRSAPTRWRSSTRRRRARTSGSRCRSRSPSRSPSALLVGLPSLRLRADYFAIATIAAAEAIRIVAQNADATSPAATQGDLRLRRLAGDSISDSIEDFIVDLGWTDVPTLFPLLARHLGRCAILLTFVLHA